MVDGIPVEHGDWIVTTEGEIGRVKVVEGDHVIVVVPRGDGPQELKLSADKVHKVGR